MSNMQIRVVLPLFSAGCLKGSEEYTPEGRSAAVAAEPPKLTRFKSESGLLSPRLQPVRERWLLVTGPLSPALSRHPFPHQF